MGVDMNNQQDPALFEMKKAVLNSAPFSDGFKEAMGLNQTTMTLEEQLLEDNNRMRKAGGRLAEAALRVITDYDGIHRLSLAVSEWAQAVADEGGRPHGGTKPKITMWRFQDAPERYRKLSRFGGDEDWVIFIPDDYEGKDYFIDQITTCDSDRFHIDNGVVTITCHS